MVDPKLGDVVKKRRAKASSNSSANSSETPGSVASGDVSHRRTERRTSSGLDADAESSGKHHHKSSRRHRKNSHDNVGDLSGGNEPRVGDHIQKQSKARRRLTGDTGMGSSASRDSRDSGSASGDKSAVTAATASTAKSSSSSKDKARKERRERRQRRAAEDDGSGGHRRRASSSDDDAKLVSSSDQKVPAEGVSTDFASAFGGTTGGTDWGFGGGASSTDGGAAFDTATFPSDFSKATPDSGGAFGSFGGGGDFGSSSDYQPPSFGSGFPPPPQPKKTYDKSPHSVAPPRQWDLTNNPNVSASSVPTKWLCPKPQKILSQICLPSPVANPLNGRWIVCRKHAATGDLYLHEMDPSFDAPPAEEASISSAPTPRVKQVVSNPILSLDLQRKVATKYHVTALAVDQVLTLAVGVHKSHGQARARVAALIDLLVLDNNEVLRIIAIWQWGYGTANSNHPVATLQSVLSPPSGSDFAYDTHSLKIGDSCVFVSGASQKGPCVFLCKPTVRETWSANFVGKESVRIASMALTTFPSTSRPYPYLAISLTDGTISVWTYEPAMKVTSKSTEAFRRLLYPLCRLEGTKILSRCPATPWDDPTGPLVRK